ncbi:MAG: hypothetical protein N2596_09375 [Syntrophorhabdaceae bacterium]|nr:hypothetical protein [Syntrophorhabdaceae bacterium]
MSEKVKKGIVFIVIGIIIPLIFLFFTSGYEAGAGFIKNLLALKIYIRISDKNIGIPYRFIVALGVIIVYIGLSIILKKDEKIEE